MIAGLLVFLGAMGPSPLEKGDPDHPTIPKKNLKIVDYFTDRMMGPSYERLCDVGNKARAIIVDMPHETFTVTTDDGIDLVGYFWENPVKTDRTALLIHGYNSNGFVDFSGVGKEYLDQGYNILITTNRASGLSGGKWIGFGALESVDSLKWLDWIVDRYPDGDIVMEGDSLGGATVNMMSDMDLPKNVKAIVSDCSFLTIKSQFIDMIHHNVHLPAGLLTKDTEFWCKKIAGYDFTSRSPLKSVKNAKVPIIFVHGKADQYITYKAAEKLYKACTSPKDILIVEGAGHAASYAVNQEAFRSKVFPFLDKYCTKPAQKVKEAKKTVKQAKKDEKKAKKAEKKAKKNK